MLEGQIDVIVAELWILWRRHWPLPTYELKKRRSNYALTFAPVSAKMAEYSYGEILNLLKIQTIAAGREMQRKNKLN